jgi:hypothetical protein
MDECASGFAGHLSRLFYCPKGCIGSDDWPAYTVGIPNGKVFFPNAKGFRLNSAYGLPIQGSSVDFEPRGICSRVFGSRQFPDTLKEKQD